MTPPKSNQPTTTSDELRRLLRKRTAVKGSIDVIIKFVNIFDPSIHTTRQIQIRLKKLDELISDFSNVQDSIFDLNEGHEDEEDRLKFEDDMYTLKSNMEDLIEKHTVVEHAHNVSSSCHSEAIRLPAITPPSFTGKLEDWASFIDTFNALFHNNPSLSDVQKLHYLKLSVTGEAANVLRNYKITADNYPVAYQELTNQYENKGLTIQTHIRALLKSPKVYKASAYELRQLHHHVSSHVRALQSLGQPIQHWDAWLVTIICVQLDPTTAGEWQLLQKSKELPTYAEIESFLSKRVAAYEVGDISSSSYSSDNQLHKKKIVNNKVFLTPSAKLLKCPLCTSSHKIYACEQFNRMSIPERKATVNKLKLCFNCLSFGHQVASCNFSSCPRCGERHNSRLHNDSNLNSETKNTLQVDPQSTDGSNAVLHARESNECSSTSVSSVMLATAAIYICDSAGIPQLCRAVLDSGSQLNFITANLAQRLQLTKTNMSVSISGVGSMSSTTVRLMPCTILSRCQNHQFSVEFHSLPIIAKSLPTQALNTNQLNIPENFKNNLADPQFNVPASVDLLLGAELFYDIFLGARHQLSNHITLHSTKLGWILAGRLFANSSMYSNNTLFSSADPNNSALSLFIAAPNTRSSEEALAESHFVSTVKRNEEGRFVVKLPTNDKLEALGDSSLMAKRRFFNLEKRFTKDKVLAEQYDAFMSEYLQLKHMELANPLSVGPKYYLPHHPVFKANSITTKMRVVFDGSATTRTGISLNDVLLRGPKVQPDIFQILIRFRIHQVAITADVEKMYRQVLIAPEDRDLQRILYRKNPADQLKEYRLCTVTYGTKPASYLATRCLSEIGKSINNSKLHRIISKDFYVDDLLSGGSSEDECYEVYNSLLSCLTPAGFPLRKWCSNSVNLINRIPTACNDPTFVLRLTDEDMVTALGLTWQPITDQFRFTFKQWMPPSNMTKRTLLSDINSVYDPIGLVSPALILGKIFIQQLWAMKLNWDDTLPVDLQARWLKFYKSLKSLEELVIPRKTVCSADSIVTIHGFCDASKDAFGACIYLRSLDSNGHVQVHLLTSKSRVAPMKATTIPRLELCGALLLAELFLETKNELNCLAMQFTMKDVVLWTDSTIVLAWLTNQVPLQSYVSNRVARILDITVYEQWRHVPSADNPADLISRGIDSDSIIGSSCWWHGPQWLEQESECWPSTCNLPTEIPETRIIKLVLTSIQEVKNTMLESHSRWLPLIRTTSWILRFVQNSKIPASNKELRMKGHLTVSELRSAQLVWFRIAQHADFSRELHDLEHNQQVSKKSCLRTLNPFIDSTGLIRVGGRLSSSSLPQSMRQPIVIHSRHKVTRLLFKYEHERLLHAGPQTLLAQMHRICWPIRGKSLSKTIVHNCVECHRFNPRFQAPLMAPLPKCRVTIERPFFRSGVDFCGPVFIKSGIRRVSSIKCYIAVFICFVTRAIHLELVTDLSTKAFLAALTRFMSRRGTCAHIHSDNATNFVGANRVLRAYLQSNNDSESVMDALANRGVQWHFSPPSAPHFGGLWEAAVKSAKHHLLKVTRNALLTFEEISTLLCRIEAILNARPLTSMSDDPSEFEALTPSHFLTGGPAILPQEPDLSTVPMNRLRRFELMTAQIQTFWKRWNIEYTPQLQKRGRWTALSRPIVVGDLAILKEDNVSVLNWNLVRVIAVHPGSDSIVRVVTVKLSSGAELKRPVTKLSIIPKPEESSEEDNL